MVNHRHASMLPFRDVVARGALEPGPSPTGSPSATTGRRKVSLELLGSTAPLVRGISHTVNDPSSDTAGQLAGAHYDLEADELAEEESDRDSDRSVEAR